MKPWVVIPAYNEAPAVAKVVASVLPHAEQVVVVDDGSDDDTAGEAGRAGALVLRHLVNRGYGAAVVTGTDYAVQRGAEAVVHFDADGQFDPQDISKLAAALLPGFKSASLGSRFLGTAEGLAWLRKLTLKLAIIFTWAVSGVRLTDAHNGLRAFTRQAWLVMQFRQDRMAFSSEVVDQLALHQVKWLEVPVTVRYTEYSRTSSKQGRFPVFKILRDLLVGRIIR